MIRRAALACLVLAACDAGAPPTVEPDGGVDPEPDAAPAAPTRVDVVLDGLQPGWRVTTSRLVGSDAPVESTVIADGSPITLAGTATDVFITTVTDETGALVETQAMDAHCYMTEDRTHHVPAEYPTIQAAIDAAASGDSVRVAAGEYTESLTMRPGVCLFGAGADVTTLDAHGEARTLVDLTNAPGSLVSGFRMRGTTQPDGCADATDPFACGGDWYRAAIYLGGTDWDDPVQYAPPIIAGNVFDGNDTAVMLYWRSVAVVRNNLFTNNRVGLVANHFQSRSLIASNVFYANTELAIGNQAAYLDIYDNVIAGSAVGIRFKYIQTGWIRCNVFSDNGANQADDHIAPPRFTIGEDGNVEGDPMFVAPTDGDFHLAPGSPAEDAGCHGETALDPDGTPPDIGAYGGALAAWIAL